VTEAENKRVLIVTGEASGDIHGAHFIEELQALDPAVRFYGVGGQRMEKAGCDILIPSCELAVVGLVEVLSHFPQIKRAFNRLKGLFGGPDRPDLLVLIDFPDFNLRLARQAKKAGIPVLYYVSPQVWAWRRGRVRKIAEVVDKLAVIFPFEPDYYRGLDIDVRYVGHPLLDEAGVRTEREDYLASLGLDPKRPVAGIFPGSRRSELRFNLETMVETAALLQGRFSEVQFLVPMAATLSRESIQGPFEAAGVRAIFVDENIYDVANACDAVLSVSGTVTLQTALVGTPMAILYRMAPLTYAVGRRLVRVDHIGLANIVAGKPVVREFVQHAARPEALAAEMERLIFDKDYADGMRKELLKVKDRMGEAGCSKRVAAMALEMLGGAA